MPLVGAAIVPNTPWLLPGLHPEVHLGIKKTVNTLKKLSRVIKSSKADVIFIIDESKLVKQPLMYQNIFYTTNLKQYGDMFTSWQGHGATGFVHSLKESLESKFNLPLVTTPELPLTSSCPIINMGLTTPLVILTFPPLWSVNDLSKIGQLINEFFSRSKSNVYLLINGTAGSSPAEGDSKIFTNAIINGLSGGKEDLMNLDDKIISCGQSIVNPAILALELFPSPNAKFHVLALESYNKVVHLTALISW